MLCGDTHSLSITKQVTASAAMTLAVLMSSLKKKITYTIRHNSRIGTYDSYAVQQLVTHITIHLKFFIRVMKVEPIKTKQTSVMSCSTPFTP